MLQRTFGGKSQETKTIHKAIFINPSFSIPYEDWGKVRRAVERSRFNQNLEENPEKQSNKWNCSGLTGAAGHMLPTAQRPLCFSLTHCSSLSIIINNSIQLFLPPLFSCLSSLLGNKCKAELHKPFKDKVKRKKNMS